MTARQPTVTIPLFLFEQLMDAHYRQNGWTPPGVPPHGPVAPQQTPESRVGEDAVTGPGEPVIDLRTAESLLGAHPGGFDPSEYERVIPVPKVEGAGDAAP